MTTTSSSFSDSKQHFLTLDALRGIAALMVVIFHVFEIYSGGDHIRQIINHGYLAVDFFFMLSGYVMAHAYDDRWDRMTVRQFFVRRLIRLHPMIVFGMTVGAVCFYFSASAMFPPIADTPFWKMLLVMLVGYTLLPLPPSMDIRGWSEMHPLDGPAWSLFFEYIANVLHALILRRLSKLMLSLCVLIAGAALVHYAVTGPTGDLIGGWSLDPQQLRIGFTRLLFPYMAGMLLRRVVPLGGSKRLFAFSALLLVIVLSFPRIGGYDGLWMNGIYDSLAVIVVFPLIIYAGARSDVRGTVGRKLCTFLGDISYPVYIIHYPLIYVLYGWVSNYSLPMEQGVAIGGVLFLLSVGLAYAALKFYDEPVRKILAARFMHHDAK